MRLADGKTFEHRTERNCNMLAYTIEGAGYADNTTIEKQHCILFGEGDVVRITVEDSLRFLFASCKPLDESIA